MSWDDLDSKHQSKEQIQKSQKERRAAEAELAKKFNRVFSDNEGKVIIEHLFNRFVMSNETPLNSPNIEYEAGYHAGEASVIKYITHQMSKAKTL